MHGLSLGLAALSVHFFAAAAAAALCVLFDGRLARAVTSCASCFCPATSRTASLAPWALPPALLDLLDLCRALPHSNCHTTAASSPAIPQSPPPMSQRSCSPRPQLVTMSCHAPNPIGLAVVALVLAAGSCSTAASAGPLGPASHSVMAFYYCWYGAPETDGAYKHWNHEVLPHWNAAEKDKHPYGMRFNPPLNVHAPFYPARGPYSSSDAATIKAHVREMLAANITVMVVSWWGPTWRTGSHDTQGVNTDEVVGTIIRELERDSSAGQDGMKLAFHLEPYEGRTVETVRADVHWLMQRFNGSSALLRVEGRPVYFVYDHYRLPPDQWAHMLTPGGEASVRGTELDGVYIGLALERGDVAAIKAGGFDGLYTYFASDAVSFASRPDSWADLAQLAKEQRLLFIPSVAPGYEDSRIRPWNAGATRSREDGARYRRYWEKALACGADAVSLTSWNEWGEGTQIEPAQPWTDPDTGRPYTDYGRGGPDLYLHLTQEYASKFIEAKQQEAAAAAAGGDGAAAAAAAADNASSTAAEAESDAEL